MFETVNIRQLDSSYSAPKYLATYGERHFVVSEPLARFIETVKRAGSYEEAAAEWSSIKGERYTADDIKAICDSYLSGIFKPDTRKGNTFLWEKELLSESQVGTLSGIFSILFRPAVLIPLTAVCAAAETVFFLQGPTVSIGGIDLLTVTVLLAAMLLSSLFHETGHAAACCYFGEKPGSIGLGIYLNFPVFYTDVSGIWKLRRKQRMVVNFAGVYFQLIFLLPCIAAYFITGNEVLKYLVYTINLNFIFTLNPFFKFDGYWIMSDLVGVPNLRSKSNNLLKDLKNRLSRKPAADDFRSQIRTREKILLTLYTVGANVFFLYYIVFVIPGFLSSCVTDLPPQIRTLVTDIAVGNRVSFGQVSSVAGQVVILMLIIFLLYKLLRKLFLYVRA